MDWLAEISADLREAVAHWRRVRDDALYKWLRIGLLYLLLLLPTFVQCYRATSDEGQTT